MRVSQIMRSAFHELVRRLVWRIAAASLIALFALAALYHATVAGTLALESQVGAIYARLIVACAFAGAALVMWGICVATRAKPVAKPANTTPDRRAMQIAMLIEAAMLGYTTARKPPR